MFTRRRTAYAALRSAPLTYDGRAPRTARTLRPGKSVAVADWEQAVLLRHGRIEQVLGPGLQRVWQAGCTVRVIDTRPWVVALPAQEAPTADGVPVKVTVAGHARVSDPAVYVRAVRDPQQSLYLAVQIALRDLLAGITLEELVSARGGLGERLTAGVRGAADMGLTVDQLVIKDIMLPGELKRAQAEVLVARAQGAAALERSRGETAALRSLVNAARLAQQNPALLQLRLIEQLGASTGHTVIISTGPQVPPAGPAGLPPVSS
jgi:regulator of protease activity HflC (stomatin/prohibitin superfamily)